MIEYYTETKLVYLRHVASDSKFEDYIISIIIMFTV